MQLLIDFAVAFDCTAVIDSVAAGASKVAQVLLHLTGLAKVTRSTLHCVCSGEQHQKPETSEIGTPQVPAADCLPCWTRHGGLQPDTTLVPLSVSRPAEVAADLLSPGVFR